jgi:hypothetical protein
MKKIIIALFFFFFVLHSPIINAKLHYRSGTDILLENSKAIDLQAEFFSKNSAYDETGLELVSSPGTEFKTSDWKLKYSFGYFKNFECAFSTNFKSVNSQTTIATASVSGIETVGLEGKYLFFASNKFSHAIGAHLKKALLTNTRYEFPNVAPADQVVLGDDGLEIGFDYYLTYTDKYFNYDFKLGYNKPSADLSSELIYNAEIVFKNSNLFLLAGLGGTTSQKNDEYTENPLLKPAISVGESRSFNAVNGERKFYYAGVQYAFGDYIVGLKGESIYAGRATDKGNTISLNFRWEKVTTPPPKIVKYQEIPKDPQKYFTQGFVGKISRSGNMLKINMGLKNQIVIGTKIDIFSTDNYTKGLPVASGAVIQVGPDWSIVKLSSRQKQSPIEVAFLAKAY